MLVAVRLYRMTNFVRNRITCIVGGTELKELTTFLAGPLTDFDFNKVILMPKALWDSASIKSREWARERWGTKWNADNVWTSEKVSVSGRLIWTVFFDTPYDHPFPVISALSKKFPLLEFAVFYADESGLAGAYSIVNSAVTSVPLPSESTMSFTILEALKLDPRMPGAQLQSTLQNKCNPTCAVTLTSSLQKEIDRILMPPPPPRNVQTAFSY